MTTLHDRIEHRLRDEICSRCRDEHPDAKCENATDFPCPLMTRLDDVIRVVAATQDYSVEPFQERVREVVCATCRTTDAGDCAHRERQKCALEAYFPQIVAIVEKELAADTGPA